MSFKMRNVVLAIGYIGISLMVFPVAADEPNPNVGKDAPALDVAAWATSKTITQEDVTIGPYVMEFWATWCGPCRQTIPHLNELAQRVEPFGVNVLGLSNEPIDKVKPFVKEMGMVYYVGAGHKVTGLEFRGIPFAAVIGADGKVVWAGHPADPEFEKKVWEVADAFVDADMKPLLETARTGSLGPLYKALESIKGAKAKSARTTLEANMALGIKLTESNRGLKKLEAMKALAELYDGVPGIDEVKKQAVAFEKDHPELQKEIKQKEALDALIAEIGKLQQKASKLAIDESSDAAKTYFEKALQPLIETFVNDNPDHPEIDQFKLILAQLKQQDEKQEKAETEKEAE